MSRRSSNKIQVKANEFKTCPVCGEKFFTGGRGDWAYKLRYNSKHYWFCIWKCLREYEKKYPPKFEPHPDIIAKENLILKEKEKAMLKFVPCTIEETRPSKQSKLKPVLEAFLKAGCDAARLEWKDEYKSIPAARRNISVVISQNGYPISLRTYEENLYLIRKKETGAKM